MHRVSIENRVAIEIRMNSSVNLDGPAIRSGLIGMRIWLGLLSFMHTEIELNSCGYMRCRFLSGSTIRKDQTMKTRKAAVLGLGHVGAHTAYALASQGIVDELILIDQNEQKVISECQDLRDAVAYLNHNVKINVGDFEDLKDCDILINSVGDISILLNSKDRVDELAFNIQAVNGYADKIKDSGFSGKIINISNPCDVITRQLAKKTGLPKGSVFGTGTALDTSRLLSALSMQTGIDHRSITAYMLGEHGNYQFTPWSVVSFHGIPLDEMKKISESFDFDKDAMQQKSIDGGWVTFGGKHCTEYGIATTAARLADAVLHDSKIIMPVSMELDGEYGETDLFAGVPCIIGKDGAEQVLELPLTEQEKETFHQCAQSIRKNVKLAEAM